MPFSQSASFSFPDPLPYPTLAVEFHNYKDAEGDGNSGLECCKACVDGIGKLVGDNVVTCPEDACAGYQREDATDEEHRDRALPPYRLQ